MPEQWVDDALKLLGGLGLLGVILTAVLQRRTGRETSAAARMAAEAQADAVRAQRAAAEAQDRNASLSAITARLEMELHVFQAGQAMWQGMFEASAQRTDQVVADLAALRVEHLQCRQDVAALRAQLEQGR